jgi:hypothetical protein
LPVPEEVAVQKSSKRIPVLAGIGAAAVAGVAALAFAVSPAQAEDPTPSPSASASSPAIGRPDHEAVREQRQQELAAALATELGIDKAKVAAALEKVEAARQAEAKADRIADLKTRLDAAVQEGKLTAEESAAILKAAEAGVFPHGGGHGPGGVHSLGGGPGLGGGQGPGGRPGR